MSYSKLLELYRSMLRIRLIEEALADRYKEQQMRCPMHLSIGQEATAVGVSSELCADDMIFSGHRAHAHYLALGGDLKRLIAELYGRVTGCAGGRGGSMHLIDLNVGFYGSTPIVGGTVPLAVGAAWYANIKKKKGIGVAFFGDGCFEEGIVHESLNFAALKRLPLLFICENNSYSVYTHLKERQPDRPIYKIAQAHGWNVWHGDGNDVLAVNEIAQSAVYLIRTGGGPQFVELKTYRWREHCGPDNDDNLGYREPGELSYWQEQCPIKKIKRLLFAENVVSVSMLVEIEFLLRQEISEAFEYAMSSPIPEASSIHQYVYSEKRSSFA